MCVDWRLESDTGEEGRGQEIESCRVESSRDESSRAGSGWESEERRPEQRQKVMLLTRDDEKCWVSFLCFVVMIVPCLGGWQERILCAARKSDGGPHSPAPCDFLFPGHRVGDFTQRRRRPGLVDDGGRPEGNGLDCSSRRA